MFVADENSNGIDLNDFPPILKINVPRHFQWPNDASKVSCIINASECVHCFLHCSFNLVFFGYVAVDCDTLCGLSVSSGLSFSLHYLCTILFHIRFPFVESLFILYIDQSNAFGAFFRKRASYCITLEIVGCD